jgi:hypothetical protein
MSDLYIGYISYYVKNLGQLVSKKEWKDYLMKYIGKEPSKTPVKNLKVLAIKLYYIHFIDLSLCMSDNVLLKTGKSNKQLKEILEGLNEFREKHDLPELSVVHYTSDADIIKHMKKFQESQGVLTSIMGTYENVVTKKKTTTKANPKKKTPSKNVESKVSGRMQPGKGIGQKVVKKTQKTKLSGACSEYTMIQLRKMAQDKNITGRSKMNKEDLCKALKL